MTRVILAICMVMTMTLCMGTPSYAHKVNIFAYVEGDTVITDSGYSRTRRVQEGVVEVYDSSTGKMLLTGKTNTTGRFDFKIPDEARANQTDLRLLLKAGTGHQAEWTVKYDEFGTAEAPVSNTAPTQKPEAVATVTTTPGPSNKEVEAIIHRELEPVKRMLAEMQETGPSMQDIIGGIGYIFGLFGIVAFMKSKK